MTSEAHQKVQTRHLRRSAFLYVRQSSLRQVFENTESTKRQYALRQRAIGLGWPPEQVVVIDCDQGISGASAADREGFQRLVTEVGMGRAGIVMGLEVSRLARNSSDWHRLLEMCALADTLILDEDGVYDPAHFNDRLLLGLKGTMSEAELHVLRARLRGGILNKARRGELEVPLPIGLVNDGLGQVVLDPDQRVQATVRALFETFRRTGSAMATVKAFRADGTLFPSRSASGDVVWREVEHTRVLWILHNPRYAGAFFFGRTRQSRNPHGPGRFKRLPREEWTALLRDAHVGYISWEEFEENQQRLRENSACHGEDRRKGPPREGPALLQGMVVCGLCGRRMTVRYHQARGSISPDYVCQRQGIQRGEPLCQHITGDAIDTAVGKLLVEAVSPLALEAALTVHAEIATRAEEADCLRRQRVEQAQYEADVARRRFMRVDPDHRLVADSLEAEWNVKLKAVVEAQEAYDRARSHNGAVLDEEQRARILGLATDFPRLWADPATPQRERKRMARLLLEDVTLLQDQAITVHVRFRGGATTTLSLPRPKPAWALRQTSAEVVAAVDSLLDDATDAQVAGILTDRGFRSGTCRPINPTMVARVRQHYGLKPRYQRLRERGLLSLAEMARSLGVAPATVKVWRRAGLLRAHAYNDKGECLFEPPDPDTPMRYKWKGLGEKRRLRKLAAHRTDEVQYEG
jgi:DNA invertase Pin-like site-specific DNA recombinase